jgi:hypothetical protein
VLSPPPHRPALFPRFSRAAGFSYVRACNRYPVYQGSNFVKQSNVILVAMNYRLGAFGWLGHASLRAADGSTGNWGLQDQRLAMQWVQVRAAAAQHAVRPYSSPHTMFTSPAAKHTRVWRRRLACHHLRRERWQRQRRSASRVAPQPVPLLCCCECQCSAAAAVHVHDRITRVWQIMESGPYVNWISRNISVAADIFDLCSAAAKSRSLLHTPSFSCSLLKRPHDA